MGEGGGGRDEEMNIETELRMEGHMRRFIITA